MSPRDDARLDDALVRAAGAELLLVASDFDGTLSPIVDDHEAAAADPGALEALLALASLPRTEAVVISGRARSDLAPRLGGVPPEVALIGSHGAELADTTTAAHPDVELYAAALADLVRETPGVRLERKPFSLAFHYRNVAASDRDRIRASAIERVAPMAVGVKAGKMVVEFLAVEADKGAALVHHRDALRREAEGGEVVTLFVGDDVTDEAAFERLSPPDVTVKVGPGETAAAYVIPGQAAVAPLLRRLYERRASATGADVPDAVADSAPDSALNAAPDSALDSALDSAPDPASTRHRSDS